MELNDLEPGQIFRITRKRYEQMIEAGVFGEDDKVQLLEGVLVQMSPQNKPHALTVVRLTTLLVRLVGDRAQLAPQVPLRAGPYSEPEPDLALWPPASQDIPERALLVIEVADSTLRIDRNLKVPIYAKANIPEYWIVDLNGDCVERYTHPRKGRYRRLETYQRGERIGLEALPDLSVAVDDVLPPLSPDA